MANDGLATGHQGGEAPELGARQLKARETRARIFDAAAKAFAEHGYRAASVGSIAKRAGVAKGTFFVHFRSKDAVVTELVRLQIESARRAADRARKSSDDALAPLRAAVLGLARHAAHDRELSRAVISASLADNEVGGTINALLATLQQELERDVRSAVAGKRLRRDVAPRAAAAALISAYYGPVLLWCTSPTAPALVSLVEPLLDTTLASFGARAPRPSPRPRAQRQESAHVPSPARSRSRS